MINIRAVKIIAEVGKLRNDHQHGVHEEHALEKPQKGFLLPLRFCDIQRQERKQERHHAGREKLQQRHADQADPYLLTRETFHQLARKVAADIQDDQAEKSWKYRVASFDSRAPVLTCRMFIPQIPIPAAITRMLTMFPMVTLKTVIASFLPYSRNPCGKSVMQYSITKSR